MFRNYILKLLFSMIWVIFKKIKLNKILLLCLWKKFGSHAFSVKFEYHV